MLVAGLLAVLVVVAGCGGSSSSATPTASGGGSTPTATATVTPSPTGTPTATATEGGPSLSELPVDPRRTFQRTADLLSVSAQMPEFEVVDERAPAGPGLPGYVRLLAARPGGASDAARIATYRAGTVTVHAPAAERASSAAIERALVRADVRAIQDDLGWLGPAQSARADLTGEAYRQGMAEFVLGAYERAHMDEVTTDALQQRYASAQTGVRYRLAPRVAGLAYYERRVDDPANVTRVVVDPPATSEQLLHDTDEGQADLTVRTNFDTEQWRVENHGPRGELATRLVLRDQLSRDRAERAAAGWAADRLITADNPAHNASGYVWVHRWDNESQADEFEAAARAFLQARRSAGGDASFEYVRASNEVTAIVAGEGGFVDVVTVQGAGNSAVDLNIGGIV